MLAGLLVDALRIGRQLVVEAVQEDALAALDQALLVRTVEVEMPCLGVLQLVVPVAQPRQGRVHGHPALHPLRLLGGEGVADHVADVVGDQLHPPDLQDVEQAVHPAALAGLVVTGGRMGRQPHAAQVRHDDRVVLDQHRHQRLPHVAGVAKAVQQQHRRALAAHAHVDGGVVDGDVADLHPRRERPHRRRGGTAEAKNAETNQGVADHGRLLAGRPS